MKNINYGKQYIDDDDIKFVVDVLKSDYLTQGPYIDKFEDALCKYTGAKYCVAVSNGTAALHLAVNVLGIEKDKEGITSPITFIASSNSMIYNGLKPVFSDVDKYTYNISTVEINNKINNKTKLIIPVHFAGQPCEMSKINELAKKNNIYLIEDACHAIGSRYEDGTRVGNCKYSDMTVFSFHPIKTITTGEGGAITTNNKGLYDKLRILRTHGISKINMSQNPGPWYYEMQELGFNYRITDIQAALGISQIKKLDMFVNRRREIVNLYNEALKNIDWLTVPYEKNKGLSCFHLYVIKIDFDKINKSRKQVMNELKEKGIGTQVHYIPVYNQPYYQKQFGYKNGDFPNTEEYYKCSLSIPLYPAMSNDDVDYVIKNICLLEKHE